MTHIELLRTAFGVHKHLIDQFHPIEVASGLLADNNFPVDIETPSGQHLIRDFAWRITEEITEALRSHNEGFPRDQILEEVIDAFQFWIELCWLVELSPNVVNDTSQPIHGSAFRLACLNFIEDLGMAVNLLKNKPWKKKLQPVPHAFLPQIAGLYGRFIGIAGSLGFSPDEFYAAYFRKAQINQERINQGV